MNSSRLSPDLVTELTGLRDFTLQPLVDYGYRGAWKVTGSAHSFLLKIDERPGLIENEVIATRHARANGIATQEVVGAVDWPVPAAAYTWVEGRQLRDFRHPEPWRAAGAVVRRIHECDPPRPGSFDLQAELLTFANELGWLREHGHITAVEATAALAAAETHCVHYAAQPSVWTHGDCQSAHFIIDETGRVAAVIDWADAAIRAPAADIAILQLDNSQRLPDILNGYTSDPATRSAILETVPLATAMRGALSLRWLETHGYPGHTWPLQALRALIQPG